MQMRDKEIHHPKLTPVQKKVFEYLCKFSSKQGFPPSYSEISEHFNFSSDGTVRNHLEQLENKGYIQRLKKARGIKILHTPTPNAIPIMGEIAAGNPISSEDIGDGTISELDTLQSKPGRVAVRVKGNSMINAGILNGDIAIIQSGVRIANGQIVAIRLDGEVTLKRIRINLHQVALLPENPDYTPMIVTAKTFQSEVIGKMIGLIRCTMP